MADSKTNPSRNPNQAASRGVLGVASTREFSQKIVRFEDQFNRLIPDAIKKNGILRADRVIGLLVNLYSTNEDIRACRTATILNSAAMAASVGLEFNNALGQSAIIPYKNEATWQPMYRGLITLASRAGRVHDIKAKVVLVQDEFEYQEGSEERIVHIPAARYDEDFNLERDWRYVYSKIRWKDAPAMPSFLVLDRHEVERVRKSSSRAQSERSPWFTHLEEMIQKTPVKRQLKMVDLTAHTALAAGWDDQAETDAKQDIVLDWKDYKEAEDLDETKKGYVPGAGEGPRGEAPPQQGAPPPSLWPEEQSVPSQSLPSLTAQSTLGPFAEDMFSPEELDWMLQQAKRLKLAGNRAQLTALLGRYEKTKGDLFAELQKA